MATSTARTVKDVNPHEFVKAYSAHLKRSGKVTPRLTRLSFPIRRCSP
jgi:small subunit ribosomal protein S19e